MGRGTTGAATSMRSEQDQHISYGRGLLRTESASWPRYVVVGGERAFAAASPSLTTLPVRRVEPSSLIDADLRTLAEQADGTGADLVVGIGGGLALDAAKSVALALDLPLVNVPGVTSTGAIVHSYWGRFVGHGRISGTKDEWPWVDPEIVIVDAEVVLQAPRALNTAGLGDTICLYAGIAELATRPESFSEKAIDTITARYRDLVDRFEATLTQDGQLTESSVVTIVEALRNRRELHLDGVSVPQGEHAFERYLEIANDRSWVHGHVTALGSVVIAWACDHGVDDLIGWFDRCHVSWRPADAGVSRDQLAAGLALAPRALPPRGPYNWDTVLARDPIVGRRFDELWTFLGER